MRLTAGFQRYASLLNHVDQSRIFDSDLFANDFLNAVVIPSDDPLYREKRARLAENDLSTQQTFQLSAIETNPLPENLLPYLRMCYATSEEELWAVEFSSNAHPVSPINEAQVLANLHDHLTQRLSAYRTSIEEDEAVLASNQIGPREAVATRLLRIEKIILKNALHQVESHTHYSTSMNDAKSYIKNGVRFA